jgi:tryptophanyl-tRNA synthetase
MADSKPKVVVSGMRPTGRLHLGHLHGALANWVALQEDYTCWFFSADWHALTTHYHDTAIIRASERDMFADFIAAGIDPEKSTLFVQSQVKEHAELFLLLGMITPVGWLERSPSYKEIREQITDRDLALYGFLGYPVLQTADVVLYKANAVPVGVDQVPHIELAREIVRKFNHHYGPVFPEPAALLTAAAKVLGTDGRKMSKSYGNTIQLTDPEDVVRQKLKTMVTDPARVRRTDAGDPDKCPVGDLHKVFSSPETMAKVYDGCRSAGIGCIECKGWVADNLVQVLQPIQERRAGFSEAQVKEILKDGSNHARARAEETMRQVRSAMQMSLSGENGK